MRLDSPLPDPQSLKLLRLCPVSRIFNARVAFLVLESALSKENDNFIRGPA